MDGICIIEVLQTIFNHSKKITLKKKTPNAGIVQKKLTILFIIVMKLKY